MRDLLQQRGPLYGLLTLIALVLGILVSWRQLVAPVPEAVPAPPGQQIITDPVRSPVESADTTQDNVVASIGGLLLNPGCSLQDIRPVQRTAIDHTKTSHGFDAALVKVQFTLVHPYGRTPLEIDGSGRGPQAMAAAEADLISAAHTEMLATAPICFEGD